MGCTEISKHLKNRAGYRKSVNLLKNNIISFIFIIYSKYERRRKNVNKQGLQETRLEYVDITRRKRGCEKLRLDE